MAEKTQISESCRRPDILLSDSYINCLFLIIIGGLLFIPFLDSVHLYDWDELNFAEAAREMLESGNFMRVTINYQPFWEKPPLFFWLQACSMKIFGINEFAARFVNAVTGIITLLVVYSIGRKRFNSQFGLLWALVFTSSFLPHVFFKSGIIDPVFNLFIFCGLTAASSVITGNDRRKRSLMSIASGAFIGLAIITKGPAAFIIFTLTLFVYFLSNRFKSLVSIKEILLFTIAMVFVSSLFYGVETIMHGTWFIREFLKYHVRLFSTGDAGHGRPFYFHPLVLLFGCFPASFFAIKALLKSGEGYNDRQRAYTDIMKILFWVVLVLFSIVKTKTVLYSSLCWFPIAYFAALHLQKLISGEEKWSRPLFVSFLVFTVIVGVTVSAFPLVMKHKQIIIPLIRDSFAVACLSKPVPWSGAECLIGMVFMLLSGVAFLFIMRKRMVSGLVMLFIACVLCVQLTLIIINPKIEQYTQADPIAFYKEHSGENEYVRSLFKSYADLFYGRKMPNDHPLSHDLRWLLFGPIDKPVYFVGRIGQDREYGSPEYGLVRLEKKYGFVYYRRDPPEITAYAIRR